MPDWYYNLPSMNDVPTALPLHQLGVGRVLWRCLAYLHPYLRLTAGAYLALLGINALALTIPQFIRWIVDRGIGGRDAHLLGWSVLTLLGLTVIRGGLTFVQGQWTETASQSVAYDLRNAIHRKLADLSFSYHDRTETGQLLSRAVQDVERIRFVTGRALCRRQQSRRGRFLRGFHTCRCAWVLS